VKFQVINMSNDDSSMAGYVAENPKLMGALFTLVLLLSQAGNAAAAVAVATSGP